MNNFVFDSRTKIYFGHETEKNIGKILKEFNANNIIFVYGKSSIKKSGLYDTVIKSLNEENIKFNEIPGVEANPKVSLVRKGVKLAKEVNPDLILAVGGGSVIDTAKAIAAGYYLDCDPWKLSTHEVKPEKVLPVGVILTIAAAGSELSNSCVITNEETNVKNGFNSDLIRPKFVVEDPELTFTVSKYQTACGITDILMHTLERFLTDTKHSYFPDEMAIGLMKSVLKASKRVMKDPNHYNGRASLMLASSFSHNGLTGLGGNFYFTVHKLEHIVSGMFDNVAHAAGLSVLYPAWAKYVYKEIPVKFARIATDVFNLEPIHDKFTSEMIGSKSIIDYEKTALLGIEEMKKFFKSLGMPVSFKDLNIDSSSFEEIANRITKNNTVKVAGFKELDYNDVINILKLAEK